MKLLGRCKDLPSVVYGVGFLEGSKSRDVIFGVDGEGCHSDTIHHSCWPQSQVKSALVRPLKRMQRLWRFSSVHNEHKWLTIINLLASSRSRKTRKKVAFCCILISLVFRRLIDPHATPTLALERSRFQFHAMLDAFRIRKRDPAPFHREQSTIFAVSSPMVLAERDANGSELGSYVADA